MDNVTHSLLGAALAQAACLPGVVSALDPRTGGLNERQASAVRALFMFTSVLANNFPDADLLLVPLTPGTLGYLLHHRGHTHVFLAVLPLALLVVLAALVLRAFPVVKTLPGSIWKAVFGLAVVGGVAHIGADSMNSYGVHPFWPFSGAWSYGDAVFIVEPLFWIVLGGYVATRSRSFIARALPAVLVGAVVAFGLRVGLLPWPALTVLGLALFWTLVSGLVLFRARPWAHAASTFLCAGGIVGAFFALGAVARAHVRAQMSERAPRSALLDVVSDPLPSNPLCWNVLTVERLPGQGPNEAQGSGDETIVTRSGRVALFPGVFPLSSCPRREGEGVALQPSTVAPSETLAFDGEASFSLGAMRARVNADCALQAWTRFTRVPVFTFSPDAAHDLRYARHQKESFSRLALSAVPTAPENCPPNVPNWTPPRADIWER
jgi:inner membrane protein